MRRNLDKYEKNGTAILENHKHAALKMREICDILDKFGAADRQAGDICYEVLSYGFLVGVETGYRLAKIEQKKT